MSGRREMTEDEFANLSDEEISGMASFPILTGSDEGAGGEGESGQEEEEDLEGQGSDQDQGEGEDDGESEGAGSDGDDPGAAGDEGQDAGEGVEGEGGETGPDPDGKGQSKSGDAKDKPKDGTKDKAADPGSKTDVAADKAATEIDYKAQYERIMAPFRANGKEIKLESPDEVIELMQKGAHFTKKLQALQPNLRLLKMLENNGLLDEAQLSYLIDLAKKKPGAVQKLVKESGVDPLDLDADTAPEYKPGNYAVSDAEMRFTSTLEDVGATPYGKQVIFEINKTWDAPSKDALWTDPDIVRVLAQQKESGIYDRIAAEIERRRVLGRLTNVPFLTAYRSVGEELNQKGLLTLQTKPNAMPAASPEVEVRPAQRKTGSATVSNGDKARAASPVRSTARKATSDFNPLALSDEEIEKNAALARRL